MARKITVARKSEFVSHVGDVEAAFDEEFCRLFHLDGLDEVYGRDVEQLFQFAVEVNAADANHCAEFVDAETAVAEVVEYCVGYFFYQYRVGRFGVYYVFAGADVGCDTVFELLAYLDCIGDGTP